MDLWFQIALGIFVGIFLLAAIPAALAAFVTGLGFIYGVIDSLTWDWRHRGK